MLYFSAMLRLFNKIDYLRKQNVRLKRSLQLKTRSLQKAIQLLNDANIKHHLSLKSRGVKTVIRVRNFLTNEKTTNKNEFIDCIYFNKNLSKFHYKYTKKFYEFSYSLYSLSSSCYEVLRSQLPFPSQSVLRERFSPQVQQIEKRLISENSIESTLQIRQKDFDDEIIYCTLAVDAFTVSNLVPKNKQNSQFNSCFLYLLIPLKFKYKSFPVFLENTKNGNATDRTTQIIFTIKE